MIRHHQNSTLIHQEHPLTQWVTTTDLDQFHSNRNRTFIIRQSLITSKIWCHLFHQQRISCWNHQVLTLHIRSSYLLNPKIRLNNVGQIPATLFLMQALMVAHLSSATVSTMQEVRIITLWVKHQLKLFKTTKVICFQQQELILNFRQATFKSLLLIIRPVYNNQLWGNSKLKGKRHSTRDSGVQGQIMISIVLLKGQRIREARPLIACCMKRKRLIRIHSQKMMKSNRWALIHQNRLRRRTTSRRIICLVGT